MGIISSPGRWGKKFVTICLVGFCFFQIILCVQNPLESRLQWSVFPCVRAFTVPNIFGFPSSYWIWKFTLEPLGYISSLSLGFLDLYLKELRTLNLTVFRTSFDNPCSYWIEFFFYMNLYTWVTNQGWVWAWTYVERVIDL